MPLYLLLFGQLHRVCGCAVVTHLAPTFEVCGSKSEPYVGKLVVVYQWSAVLYVLASSAHKTIIVIKTSTQC